MSKDFKNHKGYAQCFNKIPQGVSQAFLSNYGQRFIKITRGKPSVLKTIWLITDKDRRGKVRRFNQTFAKIKL